MTLDKTIKNLEDQAMEGGEHAEDCRKLVGLLRELQARRFEMARFREMRGFVEGSNSFISRLDGEIDALRSMFDRTRHRVLEAMGVEDKGKGWGWIESELRECHARGLSAGPVSEPLVGDVTDVATELTFTEGGMTLGKLADLIRKVALERDTALYWENHFRSKLRHIETLLDVAENSVVEGHRFALKALEGSTGVLGNYVNIPQDDETSVACR